MPGPKIRSLSSDFKRWDTRTLPDLKSVYHQRKLKDVSMLRMEPLHSIPTRKINWQSSGENHAIDRFHFKCHYILSLHCANIFAREVDGVSLRWLKKGGGGHKKGWRFFWNREVFHLDKKFATALRLPLSLGHRWPGFWSSEGGGVNNDVAVSVLHWRSIPPQEAPSRSATGDGKTRASGNTHANLRSCLARQKVESCLLQKNNTRGGFEISEGNNRKKNANEGSVKGKKYGEVIR